MARIRPGQEVLINGAGGGTGTFAVQIAASGGAVVTGVDRPEKLELVRAIGADEVIDFTQDDFTTNGQRYDVILDTAAHHSVFGYRRSLRRDGAYVMVGGSTARLLQVVLLGPLISMTGGRKLGPLLHRPSGERLSRMSELLEDGTVVPVIERTFALAEVADALRCFGEGHVRGKVVITHPDRSA